MLHCSAFHAAALKVSVAVPSRRNKGVVTMPGTPLVPKVAHWLPPKYFSLVTDQPSLSGVTLSRRRPFSQLEVEGDGAVGVLGDIRETDVGVFGAVGILIVEKGSRARRVV